MTHRKRIGFVSFGAWHPGGGLTHTGGEALHQTVELAVAAEEIGIDGAFVRVHHFARQLASPFPLLAAIGGRPGDAMLAVQPQSPSLAERIWWGSGSRDTAVWTGEQGMNLMSSTLLLVDTQMPFDQLQAEQIELFREAWSNAGHVREP